MSREEYIRLLARGYVRSKLPIPQWVKDEFDLLPVEEQSRVELPDLGPVEVWVVSDQGEFRLVADGPASGGEIVMSVVSPYPCVVRHCVVRKPSGEELSVIPLTVPDTNVFTNDKLTVRMRFDGILGL